MYRSDLASDTALAFDDLLAGNTDLQIEGPFGEVSLATVNPTHGLRIVASGTGIAQGLSLVGELSMTQPTLPTEVLWATQIETPSSRELLRSQAWLKVTRCSSAELAAQLQASVELGKGQAGEVKTVIAGPPDFVYQVTDLLLQAGVSQDNLAADAFAYAPR